MIEPAVVRQLTQTVERWRQLSVTEQDEIISDVLEAFRKKSMDGQQIAKPMHWLLAAAKRLKLATFRRRREMRIRHEVYQSTFIPDRHHGDEGVVRSRVSRCIEDSRSLELDSSEEWNQLNPDHKELFRLVFVEELQITEAAKVLGVSRSTAKSWIVRDRRTLSRDPQLRLMAKIDQRRSEKGVQYK